MYRIRYEIPTNPRPFSTRYPDTFRNTEIRNSTETAGFLELTTRSAEKIAPRPRISMKNVVDVIFISYL